MRNGRLRLAVLLVCFAASGWMLWRIDLNTRGSVTLEQIQNVVDSATEKVNLRIENHWNNRTMTTPINWQDANGHARTTTVPTERLEGESTKDLMKRHIQDLKDAEAEIEAAGGTVL